MYLCFAQKCVVNYDTQFEIEVPFDKVPAGIENIKDLSSALFIYRFTSRKSSATSDTKTFLKIMFFSYLLAGKQGS